MNEAAHPGEGIGTEMVELRVPATSAFVSILRTVTASLAARCDLTLDEIEDLRIAVDEACALLLPLARVGADLDADFTLGASELTVRVQIPAQAGAQPNRDGFGWTVLDALASDVVVAGGGDGDGDAISISLTKRRESANQ